MTLRQILLKALYPLIMLAGKKKAGGASVLYRPAGKNAVVPFYSLSFTKGDGTIVPMASFKGKKLLLCNTASNCGYTAQYNELEKLYEEFRDTLVVIAFPSNDFKEQEPLDDAAIAEFCRINFGVSFPLAKKSQVIKKPGTSTAQNPVFHWLTTASQNGWCNQQPTWNFSKYLISETGELEAFFPQNTTPGGIIKN